MTKILVPCLGCPDRNENCHSINKYPTYSCKGCAFDKARTDMGMTCRVADLLDEKQYKDVLKGGEDE